MFEEIHTPDVEMKPVKRGRPKKADTPEKAEKPPKILKNIKIWSESKQKYWYKAPPEYYREYYHRKKKEVKCEHCGAVITSQLSHHLSGQKCTLIRKLNELKAKIDNISIQTLNLEALD